MTLRSELWQAKIALTKSTRFETVINTEKLEVALQEAFEPTEGMTAAFLVTWRGRIIGERYRDGISMHTSL